MTKAVTLEAPQWIRNEHPDVISQVSSAQMRGQLARLKCQYKQACVPSLAVFEGCLSANMTDPFFSQSVKNFGLSHVTKLGGEDQTLGRVSSVV